MSQEYEDYFSDLKNQACIICVYYFNCEKIPNSRASNKDCPFRPIGFGDWVNRVK